MLKSTYNKSLRNKIDEITYTYTINKRFLKALKNMRKVCKIPKTYIQIRSADLVRLDETRM